MLFDERTNAGLAGRIAQYDLPPRDFPAFARLHLPLLYSRAEVPATGDIDRLLDGLAQREALALQGYRHWFAPTQAAPDLRTMRLVPLDPAAADVIFARFHYIRSARRDADHWALVDGTRVIAAASISPCDLSHLGSLPAGIALNQACVLSRVYAFPDAPRNTLSFMFAKLATLAAEAGQRIMLTYVNPNLGFTGVSYRAANWSLFGREHGTRYQYLNGLYVTDRCLDAQYGTAEPGTLRSLLEDRYDCVSIGLAPLLLFAYVLDERERARLGNLPARDVRRPQ